MPPEGHESVTLPNELVAQIDDHAEAIGASSRADAVRSLLDSHDSRVSARVEYIEGDVLDEIGTRAGEVAANELEGRMR